MQRAVSGRLGDTQSGCFWEVEVKHLLLTLFLSSVFDFSRNLGQVHEFKSEEGRMQAPHFLTVRTRQTSENAPLCNTG